MEPENHVASLCALVQRMVEESGNSAGFDPQAWLERWMVEEVPALGSRQPADVLNEPGGFERVRTILMGMQSGVYF